MFSISVYFKYYAYNGKLLTKTYFCRAVVQSALNRLQRFTPMKIAASYSNTHAYSLCRRLFITTIVE